MLKFAKNGLLSLDIREILNPVPAVLGWAPGKTRIMEAIFPENLGFQSWRAFLKLQREYATVS